MTTTGRRLLYYAPVATYLLYATGHRDKALVRFCHVLKPNLIRGEKNTMSLEPFAQAKPLTVYCRSSLVVRSWLLGRSVPGSKSDSSEDPSCIAPVAR
ncbi:hypothetical protein AVEN_101224-1 [Araneus ventricosus]|uniref:Uncharacterized protein n=1 Tax=Araneus ventricosus TaxID=182803 RepID=A0A4Y2FVT9_ARAVE|nr:hypothetical protein AVEN_101224-1 [Araneus ventricosus]